MVSGITTKHAGLESWDADEKEDPMMIIDKSTTSNPFIARIT